MSRFLPELVIFDLDGVLVDSEPVHEAVRQRLFRELSDGTFLELGYDPVGLSTLEIYAALASTCSLSESAETLSRRHFDETLAGIRTRKLPMCAGAREALDRLAAERIPCALASSSNRAYVEGVLDYFGVRERFVKIVTGDDVKRLKPDPEPYLAVLQALDVRPEQAAAVEDSRAGVQAAMAAGVRCYGYRNPTSGRQDLSHAYRVIARVDEMTDDFGR